MSNKNINKKLVRGMAALIIPVVVGTVFIKNDIKANASIRSFRRPSAGSMTQISNSRSSLPKLSRTDKIVGGISIGVGAVSILGTAIGLGLTESQYEQSKKNYDDVVNRTYNSFYDEREKYMKDLFYQWGVPLPEKYKNPLKTDKETKPTPGFSFGGGN